MVLQTRAEEEAQHISETTRDKAVQDLESQGGMAVVSLPPSSAGIHAHAFEVAQRAMDDEVCHYECPTIPPDADSAHVTGYHAAEGMSRYNAYREGLVFSDGMIVGNEECRYAMNRMFDSLHGIAQQVLTALERHWNLPDGWFQNTLGPTENHSQWHMKRYVHFDTPNEPYSSSQDDDKIWLPVHTDPSLISVVIHDIAGISKGAMGLEYQNITGDWIKVPQSGHGSATIFVGSVLSFITGGRIKACKHRVVYDANSTNMRMAATLFVRPRGTARLVVPPSRMYQDVTLKKQMTFDAWNSRVSRNYMKKKKHKQQGDATSETK